jgi:AraC family transcriptional regulator
MDVEIVMFPETKIAVVEHCGSPSLEHESVYKLIKWRKENKVPASALHRSYGIHYNDPTKVLPSNYRVDLGVSIIDEVTENSYGVVAKVIPALRCAKLRHLGSRENVIAAKVLYEQWLPNSNEKLAKFPIFFHYVNVGPHISASEMITDVYLPIL